MKVIDQDDNYLKRNFNSLVRRYGGKWVVIVSGKRYAIVSRSRIPHVLKEIRKKYPQALPLISPIPTHKQVQCILVF